jgi:predicted RNA-binding Zn-ribbon protein involved in translation (DUF1610 family)
MIVKKPEVFMRFCFSCEYVLDEKMEVFRSSVCPQCGKDLRVCKNCVFHSPGAHWDCRETVGEPVWDKERGNFCDFFRFKTDSLKREGQADGSEKNEARGKFDRLFGGKEE